MTADAPAVESDDERAGAKAERLVVERVRAALPPEYRLYPNVKWLGRTADHRGLRDGEADLVIAHPERGILVVEVKAGQIARDGYGRWWAGTRELSPTPFEQASTNLHALLGKLRDLPDAPPASAWHPIAGSAVALPDVDLESAGQHLRLLGPEVETDLILDHGRLLPDAGGATRTRQAIDRIFDLLAGQSAQLRAPGEQGIALLEQLLHTPTELHSLLRSEIAEGEQELIRLMGEQHHVLRELARVRRAEIRGGAGTGKTMLAIEKARQLVGQGYRTLLVCFNQPLARMLGEATADLARTGLLRVSTFHQLCEDLGREASTLPERPHPIPLEWWTQTLPAALLGAIEALGPRYHALVIDEGQDFEAGWFDDLQLLLFGGHDDVMYVFHDPAQALYRDDVVEKLGLFPRDLVWNCRNPQSIHDAVARLAEGGLSADALREGGRPPEIIEVSTPAETLEALRTLLHRLRHDEKVLPWDIAVLTGVSLERSDVWRQRVFGNEVLWNGQVDDAGRPNGLPADKVEQQPDDAILCDSIRRFKGLERPVVILTELRADDERMRRLLYVGMSRTLQHLVLVVSPEVAQAVLDLPRFRGHLPSRQRPREGVHVEETHSLQHRVPGGGGAARRDVGPVDPPDRHGAGHLEREPREVDPPGP